MTKIIDKFIPGSGRRRKEDDSVINVADMTESMYNTIGAKTDVKSTASDATPFSIVSLLKGIWEKLSNILSIQSIGAGQVGPDQAVGFSNSAPINSQVTIDFTKPDIVKARYGCITVNPSTTIDLTVKLFAKELALGGGTQYALIDTFTVEKNQSKTGTTISACVKYFEGLFDGSDLRIVVSNNTEVGAAAGFTGYIRLREV